MRHYSRQLLGSNGHLTLRIEIKVDKLGLTLVSHIQVKLTHTNIRLATLTVEFSQADFHNFANFTLGFLNSILLLDFLIHIIISVFQI